MYNLVTCSLWPLALLCFPLHRLFQLEGKVTGTLVPSRDGTKLGFSCMFFGHLQNVFVLLLDMILSTSKGLPLFGIR